MATAVPGVRGGAGNKNDRQDAADDLGRLFHNSSRKSVTKASIELVGKDGIRGLIESSTIRFLFVAVIYLPNTRGSSEEFRKIVLSWVNDRAPGTDALSVGA